jgi:hypothetical protein
MADRLSESLRPSQASDDEAVRAGVPAESPAGARSRRRAPQSPSSPHASRFRSLTAVLVGLAVGALVIAGAIAAGGRATPAGSAKWSAWSPTDGGTLGARDIAAYVAPFYRLSAVQQLSLVTVVNLESASAAAAQAQAQANGTTAASPSTGLQVAVRPSSTSSQVSLLTGNTIAYNLCGIGGKDCAIGGQASTDRLLLLRREALELALYTFKYVGATQNVVAILPPGHTQTTTTSRLSKTPPTATAATTTAKPVDIAVLFQRQEVQPLLDHPLLDSLPEVIPPTVTQISKAPEAGLVDQVTARGLFSEQLQTAQDGSNLIVLDPLPPQ